MNLHRARIARIVVVGLGAFGLVAVGPVPADAAATYSVTATVPVGNRPYAVAVDSARHTAYVANYLDGTVSVIDEATNAVIKTITVGAAPDGLAVDSDRGLAYVANGGSDTVSVVNETTNQVVRKIPVGRNPIGVAVDTTLGRVFVANNSSQSMSVINESSRRVIKTVMLSSFGNGRLNATPYGVAVDPTQGKVYVTDPGNSAYKVVDETTFSFIDGGVPGTPTGIAVDTVTHVVYVAEAEGMVFTPGYSYFELPGEIALGSPVYGITVDTANGTVTAADVSSNVAVIDTVTRAVVGSVEVGRGPLGVGLDDVTHTAVVANSHDASISTIAMAGLLPPRVAGIVRDEGPETGGQTVIIRGEGFTGATAVRFGVVQATSFTVDSPHQITAVTPVHAPGLTDIHVRTPGGISGTIVFDHYRFLPRPTITSVSPNSGPAAGGQFVTIEGTNLYRYPAPVVRFGGVDGRVYSYSSTEISVFTPPHAAGTVDIVVTSDGGPSVPNPNDLYSFTS